MKKFFIFFIFICLSFISAESKVKISRDAQNKTTNEVVIETDWYSFSTENNKNLPNIHIRFKYEYGKEFIEIKHIINSYISILDNHRLSFSNGNEKTLYANALVRTESKVGDGAISYLGSHNIGINQIYNGDFSWLLFNAPQKLIIQTTFEDIEIILPKNVQKDIQKLYKALFKRIEKRYKK